MHERDRQEPELASPTPAPVTGMSPLPRILQLQRSAVNRAVTALLQRQAPPAAPPNAQAAAEADAVQTVGLLRDTHRLMLASPEARIRNTAQMMDAPGERS